MRNNANYPTLISAEQIRGQRKCDQMDNSVVQSNNLRASSRVQLRIIENPGFLKNSTLLDPQKRRVLCYEQHHKRYSLTKQLITIKLRELTLLITPNPSQSTRLQDPNHQTIHTKSRQTNQICNKFSFHIATLAQQNL